MFIQLATGAGNKLDTDKAKKIFDSTPSALEDAINHGWEAYRTSTDRSISNQRSVSSVVALPENSKITINHLIYAYMIENTRIYEIFQRVVYEFMNGEKLGSPSASSYNWLRNTEELFYRDTSPLSLTSYVRPDTRAIRRNAYWRMFGMDLNHGASDGQLYPYIKADAYNNEFVTVFEELLREAWIAISNFANSSGPNPTDEGKIKNLVINLRNMLKSRREGNNLSREEFLAVAAMSWFHLTVSLPNLPIITDLRAETTGPEQVLNKIAQRVNMPAHGLSKSFFDVADVISDILMKIEDYIDGGNFVTDLVKKKDTTTDLTPVQKNMNTIITHWSIITGRDVKAGKVAVKA